MKKKVIITEAQYKRLKSKLNEEKKSFDYLLQNMFNSVSSILRSGEDLNKYREKLQGIINQYDNDYESDLNKRYKDSGLDEDLNTDLSWGLDKNTYELREKLIQYQKEIGSNFIILTKKQLNDKIMKAYNDGGASATGQF